ncbi:hypothetical protein VNO77_11212 [Canavalia gladiata]|uniref:Uncharacterized protein n=1 Tax=Canavalia gladiata TaxID=3824 RepID=A0AAN9MBY0_CANGL
MEHLGRCSAMQGLDRDTKIMKQRRYCSLEDIRSLWTDKLCLENGLFIPTLGETKERFFCDVLEMMYI